MVTGRPVSGVVLNYNGAASVIDCVESLARQTVAGMEIIVVDNASTDGSADRVAERFPEVRMIRLSQNQGYAGGMNAGISASGGEFVVLLNFDAVLDPSYAGRCIEALRSNPSLGGVTGKLLKRAAHSGLLDTTGHLVFRNRRPVDRGEFEEDQGQYDGDTEVFGVCGAAPCYRRAMLDDVRIDSDFFDEDFFAYFEDFDLCWRGRLRGWGFGYVPSAVGHHSRGGAGGKAHTAILAANHRNRILTLIKCDHPASFIRHFPGILYTELRATLHMVAFRPAALFRAWGSVLRLLPRILRKRRKIQRSRTVGWRELERWFHPYDYRAAFRRISGKVPV